MGDIIYVLIAGVYENRQVYNVNTDIDSIIESYIVFMEDSPEIEFWKNGDIYCPIYGEYDRWDRRTNEINKEAIKQDILKYIEENNYSDEFGK